MAGRKSNLSRQRRRIITPTALMQRQPGCLVCPLLLIEVTIAASPARSGPSAAPVHDIKQTVSLTEVVMSNKGRPFAYQIDTHDAARGHFQLFFAVADENNGLTKSDAVALHGHRAAREWSDWRQRISSPLRGCLRAAAKPYHRCDKRDRENAFCHWSSSGELRRERTNLDSGVEAALQVGGMSNKGQKQKSRSSRRCPPYLRKPDVNSRIHECTP